MSRRSRRRRDVSTPTFSSLVSLPRVPSPSPVTLYPFSGPLTLIEDRRTFHPLGPQRGAVSFSGAQHGLRLSDREVTDRFHGLRKFPSQTKAVVAFDAPDDVLVCVRRRRRKEVLFAKRKTGRRGQRRPRRNWFSQIHC